jgi:hypothetical protein
MKEKIALTRKLRQFWESRSVRSNRIARGLAQLREILLDGELGCSSPGTDKTALPSTDDEPAVPCENICLAAA